jgi:cytochrome c biogenesis protein CcdA
VAAVLRLIGIVLSIGLADSLDPTTLGPGLYLALGKHPARRVLNFAIGVFLVMVISGLTVVLLPGQLLLHLVPHPRRIVEYWLETAVGAGLGVGAFVVWRYRSILSARELFRARETRGTSSLLLGVGVMTVNLPVAVPYFAAIAAIVGSGRSLAGQSACIVLYSFCFVAPLVGMVVVLWLAPARAEVLLGQVRGVIQRHWAGVLAVVLVLAGGFVIVLGLTGVVSRDGGHLGHLARHVHHLIS